MFDSKDQQKDLTDLWAKWEERGEQELSCSGLPDLFFPEKGEPVADIKALCSGCSIIQECGLFGLKWGEQGIWGGMSGLDRRIINKQIASTRRIDRTTRSQRADGLL